MRGLVLLTLSTALAATGAPVLAQSSSGHEFSQPIRTAPGQETRPFPGARGPQGNRVVINGIIQTGVGVSASASAHGSAAIGVTGGVHGAGPFAHSSATAIGNQLNVVVSGRNNVVVVNSEQTNTGDISAEAGASANGQTDSEDDNG